MMQPPTGNEPPPYGQQPPYGGPPNGPGGYGQQPYGGPPNRPGGYGQQPPNKQTGLVIALAVIALLLIAGAVGGFLLLRDDNGSDDIATTESPSATATSAQSTSAAPATSVLPPSPNLPTGSDVYCQTMQSYDGKFDLANGDFSSPAGQQNLLEVMQGLQVVAPAELQDDYQVLTEGSTAYVENRPEDIDQAALNDAFATVSTDAQATCGVDMGG